MHDEAKEFSARFKQACDDNPRIPKINFGEGRLSYLRSKLAEIGVDVTLQSVSRWYNGLAVPRDHRLVSLANILEVSPEWLRYGVETNEIKSQSAGTTKHFYNLRPDFEVILNLPGDLTEREAERLARYVTTLPLC